jgi:hypothetical protein
MATIPIDYNDPNIQGLIRGMFFNVNGTPKYKSTIKHQTVNNVNLDLFVDSLHDKLARIFCLINRNLIPLGNNNNCPKTVDEDLLFNLRSKHPSANNQNETIMQHFINSVVTKTVIPLFDNINQNELRIKDIFKFFFLLCFSNLIDPADTSGENFIKHLRKKTGIPGFTLPFEHRDNLNRFQIFSNHTYSMCGDKLLYAYINLIINNAQAQAAGQAAGQAAAIATAAAATATTWAPNNVRDRHLVILNFVWQCTLTYIESISQTNARFPAGGPDPNTNFPTQAEIELALNILRQIHFDGFILQSTDYDHPDRIDDYRYYTYANATFIFRNEQPQTAAEEQPPPVSAPFAVSQGIAAECINELYQGRLPADAALPREGAPHQYKVRCKNKLQTYINSLRNNTGQPLTPYQKSVIYVLLKFAGDTSHLVNYMLLNYAIEGKDLPIRAGSNPPQPIPVLPANDFFNINQLKATIFCCERALIARCIQENHSFYCRDVKVLSQHVPLALGDCYYFNVNPMEEYTIKRNLLQSFRVSAGGLQDDIDAAIGHINAIIAMPNPPPLNDPRVQQVDQLITFINFYKTYMTFDAFIRTSRNKYIEFVERTIPSQFRPQSRSGRIRKILNISTPLSSLFESLRKKKTFEKASFISAAYYSPLVSILSQLKENEHIRDKVRRMGINHGPDRTLQNDIIETLQTITRDFITRIDIRALIGVGSDDDIRTMLSPDNNNNDTKLTELIINIIKCQREIDSNLENLETMIGLIRGQNGGDLYGFSDDVFTDDEEDDNVSTVSTDSFGSWNEYDNDGVGHNHRPDDDIIDTDIEDEDDDIIDEIIEFINNNSEEPHEEVSDIDRLVIGYIDMNDRRPQLNGNNNPYSYNKLANDILINYTNHYRNLCLLFDIVTQYELIQCVEYINNPTRPKPNKLFKFELLIKYFASMINHQENLNIISSSQRENTRELLEYVRNEGYPEEIERNMDVYHEIFDEMDDGDDDLGYDVIHNRPYKVKRKNHEISENGAGVNPRPRQEGKKRRKLTVRRPPHPSKSPGGRPAPFGRKEAWALPPTTITPAAAAENTVSNFKQPDGSWFKGGRKNIRSISKIYRKNNKKVKNVKKTRKNRKNNDKKSKTSKKMTKTSVQNKKSIRNKSIKNMKNTKNKKDNKSKTKKSKKN